MKSSESDVVAVSHTPTPWHVEEMGFNVTRICAPDRAGYVIAEMESDSPCRDANAAFIVKAVNCHDDLLEACKALVADGECSCVSYRTKGQCPQCRAREVIDRATTPQVCQMNVTEAKGLAIEALRNTIGDDLYRAKCAFRGMTNEQMQEKHGESGKTRQQIIDEYQAYENRVNDAINLLKTL